MLEVEVKSLGPGPSFELRDLTDNALSVLDRFFRKVAVLQNSLAGFFFSVLGPRTGAQPTMNSAANFAFHSRTLALGTGSGFCETATPGPVWAEPG